MQAHYITFYLPRWWSPLCTLAAVLHCIATVTGAYWLMLIATPAALLATHIYLSYWRAARQLRRVIGRNQP